MSVSAMFAISSQRQRSQGADRRLVTKKVVGKAKAAKPRLPPVQPFYSPQGLASPESCCLACTSGVLSSPYFLSCLTRCGTIRARKGSMGHFLVS